MLQVLNNSDLLPIHSRQSWIWNHLLDQHDCGTFAPGLVTLPSPFTWMDTVVSCEPFIYDLEDRNVAGESYNILKLRTRHQHVKNAYVLLFTCNLYGHLGSVLNNANLVNEYLRTRMVCNGYPKTCDPTHGDIGVIAYDVTEKYILIHHTQINGLAGGVMTGNQISKFCRTMIRSVSSLFNLPIIAPTIEMIRAMNAPLAYHAYNSSVFTPVDGFCRKPLLLFPDLYNSLDVNTQLPLTTSVWYHE